MERIAYARLFSTIAGLALVALGLAGFATAAGFRNPEITSDLVGFYPVNGWANTLHLAAGLIGLGLARPLPRLFALVAGILFFALGVWGVLAPDGHLLFGVLPATRSVNLLNLLLGAFGLVAYIASRWDRIRTQGVAWLERIRRRRERRKRQKRRQRAVRRRSGGDRKAPEARRKPSRPAG